MGMTGTILTATVLFENAGIMTLIWLGLVILFIVLEIISLGLTSIWFAVGALASGIVAMLGGPIALQIIVFLVVSVVLLACTRGIARRHLDNRIERTNAEGLIGRTSIVMETIDNAASTGKIKIGDVEWTARAVNEAQVIPKDTKIIIREIHGVKCMVEPVSVQV